MQANQLEPPIERVGDPARGEELGPARLRDNRVIAALGGCFQGIASKQRSHRGRAAQRRALTAGASRIKVERETWGPARQFSTQTAIGIPCSSASAYLKSGVSVPASAA